MPANFWALFCSKVIVSLLFGSGTILFWGLLHHSILLNQGVSTLSFILSQDCFDYSEFLCVSTQNLEFFLKFCEKCQWHFVRDHHESVDCLGYYWHFNNINSSNARMDCIFPSVCVIFNFFQECLIVSQAQVFYFFSQIYP